MKQPKTYSGQKKKIYTFEEFKLYTITIRCFAGKSTEEEVNHM